MCGVCFPRVLQTNIPAQQHPMTRVIVLHIELVVSGSEDK